jgi:hypothetical protein
MHRGSVRNDYQALYCAGDFMLSLPMLGAMIWIGGGGLGLIILIVVIVLLLRK